MCSNLFVCVIFFFEVENMSIAENIKSLRKEKKLTQKQLAEKTGIAVITIQNYEAGKYEPKNQNLRKLAAILDPTGERLLGEDLPFNLVDLSASETIHSTSPVRTVSDFGLDLNEHKLIDDYRLLNKSGKEEAIKRVEELTEIMKYTKPDILINTEDGSAIVECMRPSKATEESEQ